MTHDTLCYRSHDQTLGHDPFCQCAALAKARKDGMTESYHRGFDDARWIAAKEALEAVQHEEPCDCGPCQAISRALAELRTIGQD